MLSEPKFKCQGCMTEFDSPNAPHNYQECLEFKVSQLETELEKANKNCHNLVLLFVADMRLARAHKELTQMPTQETLDTWQYANDLYREAQSKLSDKVIEDIERTQNESTN